MTPTDGYQVNNIKPGKDYVFLLEDMEFAMTKDQLERVTKNWNNGIKITDIAQSERRDPVEVLIALIHQARRGIRLKPLGVSL